MSRGEPTLDELVASAGCGIPQPGFVVGSGPPPPRKRLRLDGDAVEQWDGRAGEVCVTLARVAGAPTLADLDQLAGPAWRGVSGLVRRVVCPAAMTIDHVVAAAFGDELPKHEYRAFVHRWCTTDSGADTLWNCTQVPFVVAPDAHHTVGWVAQAQGRAGHLEVLLAPAAHHELPRREWLTPYDNISTQVCKAHLAAAAKPNHPWHLRSRAIGVVGLNVKFTLSQTVIAWVAELCPRVWKLTVVEVVGCFSCVYVTVLIVSAPL
jgi:hypothetical protein